MIEAHFYIDAIALGISILGLIPIYKNIGRKYFAVILAFLLASVVGASFWMAAVHRQSIERTQRRILVGLRAGQKTFDELAHSLPLNDLEHFTEALGDLLDRPAAPVGYDDIRVQNCDLSIVAEVRRYYLKP